MESGQNAATNIIENIENIESIKNSTTAQETLPTPAINEATKLYYAIFNRSTITLVLWFLIMKFVFVYMIRIYMDRNVNPTPGNSAARIFDFALLSFLLLFFTTSYYSYSEIEREEGVARFTNGLLDFADMPSSIFTVTACIIMVYFVIYLLGFPMNPENKPYILSGVENFAWFYLLFIVIVDFFKYILGLSFVLMVRDYFGWASLPVDAPGSIMSVLKYDVYATGDEVKSIFSPLGGLFDIKSSAPVTTLSPTKLAPTKAANKAVAVTTKPAKK
jgi:hypothetical protein